MVFIAILHTTTKEGSMLIVPLKTKGDSVPKIVKNPAVLEKRKEFQRIWEFLQNNAQDKTGNEIEGLLNNLMLDNFGWSEKEGKRIVKQTLKILAERGSIEYSPAKGGGSSQIKVAPIDIPSDRNGEQNHNGTGEKTTDKSHSLSHINPKAPRYWLKENLARGEARKLQKSNEYGEKNEYWTFLLMQRVADALIETKSAVSTECRRTDHHNPKKGTPCLLDKNGEDFRLYISRRTESGQLEKKYIIWDNKSSRAVTEDFNTSIKLRTGQNGASGKRAIWGNKRERTEQEVVGDMLDDLTSFGLIDQDVPRQDILERFDDFIH